MAHTSSRISPSLSPSLSLSSKKYTPNSPTLSLISSFFIISHLSTLHQNPIFISSILITPTMSLAPSSYASLYSSPPLPRAVPIRQSSFCKLPCSNHSSIPTCLISFCNTHLGKPSILVVRASETESSQTSESESEEEKYEEYEVELLQPYGLKFAKGRDGRTYIDAIAPGGNADRTNMFTVGDKVLATSAVFGTEIWPAAEYGRTMYTIRQRIGPLLMRMQKRYGKTDNTGELTEKEIIRAERNSGFISNRVREIQMINYQRKMEQKERRAKDLREGLQLYRSGKYEEALEKFESVLGSKPDPNEASVASYNVACCYSKLNQIKAGLSALEDAMEAGYEDFKTIRTDPDLDSLRKSEEFEPLLKKFDESFINENAIDAIKSLFGLLKKE